MPQFKITGTRVTDYLRATVTPLMRAKGHTTYAPLQSHLTYAP
jgi:hypothetical protein